MNVRELKQLLAKFPPDCDDMHVFLTTAVSGKPEVDLVSGTGYFRWVGSNGEELTVIAIIGHREIQRQVESGRMEAPEGYRPADGGEGEEWKKG